MPSFNLPHIELKPSTKEGLKITNNESAQNNTSANNNFLKIYHQELQDNKQVDHLDKTKIKSKNKEDIANNKFDVNTKNDNIKEKDIYKLIKDNNKNIHKNKQYKSTLNDTKNQFQDIEMSYLTVNNIIQNYLNLNTYTNYKKINITKHINKYISKSTLFNKNKLKLKYIRNINKKNNYKWIATTSKNKKAKQQYISHSTIKTIKQLKFSQINNYVKKWNLNLSATDREKFKEMDLSQEKIFKTFNKVDIHNKKFNIDKIIIKYKKNKIYTTKLNLNNKSNKYNITDKLLLKKENPNSNINNKIAIKDKFKNKIIDIRHITINNNKNNRQSKLENKLINTNKNKSHYLLNKNTRQTSSITVNQEKDILLNSNNYDFNNIKDKNINNNITTLKATIKNIGKIKSISDKNQIDPINNMKQTDFVLHHNNIINTKHNNELYIDNKNIINQISNFIEDNVNKNIFFYKNSATLQLHPPELGKIKIELKINNNIVNATFIADHPDIRQILEANLQLLKQQLAQGGLQLNNCFVNLNMNSNKFYSNSYNNSKKQNKLDTFNFDTEDHNINNINLTNNHIQVLKNGLHLII